MKQVLYVIPGFREDKKNKKYRDLEKIARGAGFKVKIVNISWGTLPYSFEKWSKEFLAQYKREKGSAVLGFSFGAIIACLTAARSKPSKLILCSLSPYFVEGQRRLRIKWLRWWRKNMPENNYWFKDYLPSIKMPTQILVGGREAEECLRRARSAKRLIPGSTLQIVSGSGHNIGSREYLAALKELFTTLPSSKLRR
jgi:pimeloyl-ACP methyl ester carboxylesterase